MILIGALRSQRRTGALHTSFNSLNSGACLFWRRSTPLAVRNASKQAGFFQRVGSLRTGRHPARFLKGIHRACILAADVRGGFLLHDHILKGPSNSKMRGGMPYAGGRNSPTSQPTSPDFIGSDAMAICST
jgi:hypothetical protein